MSKKLVGGTVSYWLMACVFMTAMLGEVTNAEDYYVCDEGAACNAGARNGWLTGSDG